MACELLILPLRPIPSAREGKVEAKPAGSPRRERSQDDPAMGRREVASRPSRLGSRLGRSRGRETLSLSKSVLSASVVTGRAAAYAVSGALMAPALPAITSGIRNVRPTDEVPRRPRPSPAGVSGAYKSDTKGPRQAPVTGTGSPRPGLQGCPQRQSMGAWIRRYVGGAVCLERQNLRVPPGRRWFMGQVSPAVAATKWPGGTSSRQTAGPLRNRPQQPAVGRAAVRSC